LDAVSAYGGGTINVKHGIYDLTDTTPVMRNNEHLLGEGASSTILLNNLIRVYGDTQEVAYLTINPQGRKVGAFRYDGVQLEGQNKYIHDNQIYDWTNYAVDVVGFDATYGSSTNVTIERNTMVNYGSYQTNGGVVIATGGYNNLHIKNNIFGKCTNNCQFMEVFIGPGQDAPGDNNNLWFENNDVEGPFSKTAYLTGHNLHILNNE
jgi:hypothetical protein